MCRSDGYSITVIIRGVRCVIVRLSAIWKRSGICVRKKTDFVKNVATGRDQTRLATSQCAQPYC